MNDIPRHLRNWVPLEKTLHACPMCPVGEPVSDCACCGGHGSIDESRLMAWNAELLKGFTS